MVLAIRPEDLLGRETVHAYGAAAKVLINNKTVLVTGAGGSIGAEIVRQVQLLQAKRVYFIDNDEFALYALQMGQAGSALLDDEAYRLADIRDEPLMRRIMDDLQPDIVFHAAAHKHLPLLERAPEAAVKTNVFGTESVIRAAVSAGVDRIVNISTDKAANPSSALGWSKRIAEQVAANYAAVSATRIASVRFGNVLGSRGSFLPTLVSQIEGGGRIKITDPEVSRFFMTIPEAAALVIEAACLATRGETYVLDMGASVRIEELVNRYVRLSGCAMPTIEYTGLRAGEKLFEELFDLRETHHATSHPRIWAADVGRCAMDETLSLLRQLVQQGAHPRTIRTAMEFHTDREVHHELALGTSALAHAGGNH